MVLKLVGGGLFAFGVVSILKTAESGCIRDNRKFGLGDES